MTKLTQEHLKEGLKYDPETGDFSWLSTCGNIHKGKIAGYIHHTGYQHIGINGSLYLSHRLAWLYMTGNFPKYEIDHINRVKKDNRWVNLRECSHAQNMVNFPIRKDNTSGFKGVTWNKKSKKWQSQIIKNGKGYYLGSFDNKIEAAKIYNKKALELYGEFAFQNII